MRPSRLQQTSAPLIHLRPLIRAQMIFLRSLVTRHDWEYDFYVDDNDTLDSSPYCGPLHDVVTAIFGGQRSSYIILE
jgi:hypothetical protein